LVHEADLRDFLRKTERVLWTGLSLLILVMVLAGTLNTVFGFVAKHEGMSGFMARLFGTNWSSYLNPLNEFQWYLFSMVFLLGGAFLVRQDGHVRVDVLYERLSPRKQRGINAIGTLLLLLPWAGLMFWVSLEPVRQDIAILRTSDSTSMPHWLIQICVPVGFAMLFLVAAWELGKLLFPKLGPASSAAAHASPEVS